MKELFKALEISENNDKNLARKLQLERIIDTHYIINCLDTVNKETFIY